MITLKDFIKDAKMIETTRKSTGNPLFYLYKNINEGEEYEKEVMLNYGIRECPWQGTLRLQVFSDNRFKTDGSGNWVIDEKKKKTSFTRQKDTESIEKQTCFKEAGATVRTLIEKGVMEDDEKKVDSKKIVDSMSYLYKKFYQILKSDVEELKNKKND